MPLALALYTQTTGDWKIASKANILKLNYSLYLTQSVLLTWKIKVIIIL